MSRARSAVPAPISMARPPVTDGMHESRDMFPAVMEPETQERIVEIVHAGDRREHALHRLFARLPRPCRDGLRPRRTFVFEAHGRFLHMQHVKRGSTCFRTLSSRWKVSIWFAFMGFEAVKKRVKSTRVEVSNGNSVFTRSETFAMPQSRQERPYQTASVPACAMLPCRLRCPLCPYARMD